MQNGKQLFFSFFLICLSLVNFSFLIGDVTKITAQPLTVNDCLLPNDHPLQEQLKNLFENDKMFKSPDHLRDEGFDVLDRVHRSLMVAGHPSIKNFLIKKFQNKIPQKDQLNNYLKRINGARTLSRFIQSNNLKHIVVPQKWLYPLPKQFSDQKSRERSYVLIVEKMDICNGGKDPEGEVAEKYYTIDEETLRELCLVLYHFRGLDSMLHNVPFTQQDQIAFIDTERWERKREGYLRHILPYLSEDKQEYALALLLELQYQDQ